MLSCSYVTTTQLFFALVAVMCSFAAGFKLYLDAKINPVAEQVNTLIDNMVLHEGKIGTLQERTKNL